MAETRPLDFDISSPEMHSLPVYRRLGLLNGLLIGLALGLGAWALEAWRISRLPIPLYLPTLLLGIVILTLIGGLAGWLSARLARPLGTVAIWVLAAILTVFVMGYLPAYGRSLMVWLADPRFAGRMVFPFIAGGTASGLLIGGLLILLVLIVLALLQGYRLDNMTVEARRKRTLGLRTWVALILPLPFVFLASLATYSMMSNPAATAAGLTHEAIRGAQGFDGDLRDLGEVGGINYVALRAVQDAIDGLFSLGVVDMTPLTSTVIIAAHFDSGAWIHCRVINDQLSFCYDATPAYVAGLHSHVTGEPPAEDCPACVLRAEDDVMSWLTERREQFGPDPTIQREAQWGNTALMRVTNEATGYSVLCWIEGTAPVILTECEEQG